MSLLALLLGCLAWLLCSTALAIGIGRAITARAREHIRGEAWDAGFQHGASVAHGLVVNFPKPYITMGEERGWDYARVQLANGLAELLDHDVERLA